MRLTSSHVYLLDPLNIMCSRKCDTPLIDASSSREPVLTNRPSAVEWESGLTSAITSRPLASCLWWKVRGIGFPSSVVKRASAVCRPYELLRSVDEAFQESSETTAATRYS